MVTASLSHLSRAPRLAMTPILSGGLREIVVFVIFFVALLAPQVQATADLNVRAELIALAIYMLLFTWLLLAGLAEPIRLNGMFVASFVFCICVGISMLYGTDILHHELLTRDYFELLKAFVPTFFFTVTYVMPFSERGLNRFLSVMVVPIALICFYAWAQYLDLGFTYYLNPLYSGGEHIDISLRLESRVYSTFSNPNVLGQFLCLTVLTYTGAFLFAVGNKLRNLGVSLLCMTTVVLTGSRYSILSIGLGLFLLFCFVFSVRRSATKVLAFFLLLGIFSYAFITVQRGAVHAQKRFEELRHPSDVASLRQRLDHLWLEAGDFIVSSPFVGHGPAKRIFTGVFTDSEYLDVLKQFGFVGFIPYICLYLWPLYHLRRGWLASKSLGHSYDHLFPATVAMARIGVVIVVVALFMNIGMFTYFNWELMAFLWMMMGLTTRCARNIYADYEARVVKMPGHAMASFSQRITGIPAR